MIKQLQAAGWTVAAAEQQRELPDDFEQRYSWAPTDFTDFAVAVDVAVSANEKAWILTSIDFRGESETAFEWNAWENLSLDAAGGDRAWQQRIRSFWDDHLPIVLSVKSGYAFFAIERTTLRVVVGEEPEFEETTPMCQSFTELVDLIAARSPRLDPWI